MENGKLSDLEMQDLKEVTEDEKKSGGTEYTIIAKYHDQLAQKTMNTDYYAFRKHSAIAILAEHSNERMANNKLEEGELEEQTKEILLRIDEDPTDTLLREANDRYKKQGATGLNVNISDTADTGHGLEGIPQPSESLGKGGRG